MAVLAPMSFKQPSISPRAAPRMLSRRKASIRTPMNSPIRFRLPRAEPGVACAVPWVAHRLPHRRRRQHARRRAQAPRGAGRGGRCSPTPTPAAEFGPHARHGQGVRREPESPEYIPPAEDGRVPAEASREAIGALLLRPPDPRAARAEPPLQLIARPGGPAIARAHLWRSGGRGDGRHLPIRAEQFAAVDELRLRRLGARDHALGRARA